MFGLFQVLYTVGKQAYKLEPPKQWKIHNIFHVSLLGQDTTKKEWEDEKVTELEFESGNNLEYKVKTIWDSAVYANKAEGHLPGLYYLVAWKKYPKKENTWELLSAV